MKYLATFSIGLTYHTKVIEAENFFQATTKLAKYIGACIDLKDVTILSLVKL